MMVWRPREDSRKRRSSAQSLSKAFDKDAHPDCAFLLSPEGQQALVDLHVDGICAYLASVA